MPGSGQYAVSGEKKVRVRPGRAPAPDDIGYRGPLSYRAFQVLGWFCIVVAQVVIMVSVGSRFTAMNDWVADRRSLLSDIAEFALPFLLIANFTLIMNGQRTFRTLLLKNFFAMAGLSAAWALLLGHYITGVLTLLSDDPSRVTPVLFTVLSHAAENGFYCFNIFTDLFLCTLVMYFLHARPRRFFTGKKLLLFRSFVLIPLLCELICMSLKIRTARGAVRLSPYLYPLLTVKPPMTFLLFVILAAFIKIRELRFIRRGGTYEEYRGFLDTNRNSLGFSVFLSVMLIAVSLADCLAVRVMSGTGDTEPVIRALGFGDSRWLFALVPPVLLFSYTREPKKAGWNMAVPLAGLVLIVLVYLQGLLQILHYVNLPRINLDSYTPLVLVMLNNIR